MLSETGLGRLQSKATTLWFRSWLYKFSTDIWSTCFSVDSLYTIIGGNGEVMIFNKVIHVLNDVRKIADFRVSISATTDQELIVIAWILETAFSLGSYNIEMRWSKLVPIHYARIVRIELMKITVSFLWVRSKKTHAVCHLGVEIFEDWSAGSVLLSVISSWTASMWDSAGEERPRNSTEKQRVECPKSSFIGQVFQSCNISSSNPRNPIKPTGIILGPPIYHIPTLPNPARNVAPKWLQITKDPSQLVSTSFSVLSNKNAHDLHNSKTFNNSIQIKSQKHHAQPNYTIQNPMIGSGNDH